MNTTVDNKKAQAQNVGELVKEIRENLSQVSSSAKDEVRVMRAMLNDRDFKVDVWSRDGVVGQYSPAEDARAMIANVVSATTKVPMAEATSMADNYEFKKNDAETMVNISKEFINTYLQTDRKLPLGARETSNIAISHKHVPATVKSYPVKTGINDDGSNRFGKGTANVAPHDSIKVFSPCPPWVKADK